MSCAIFGPVPKRQQVISNMNQEIGNLCPLAAVCPATRIFFVLIRCGGYGQPETHKRKVEK